MRGKNVLIYKSGFPNVVSNHLWFASSPQHPFPTIWLPWFIAIILKKCPQVYLLKHSSHTDLPSVPQLCQLFHSICLSFPKIFLTRLPPHSPVRSLRVLPPWQGLSWPLSVKPSPTLLCLALPISLPLKHSHPQERYVPVWDYLLNSLLCSPHEDRNLVILLITVHNLYSVHQLSRN